MAESTKEENDLSAFKNLTISLHSKGLEKLGYIYSIMEKLVIVEALEDLERLENEALLYLSPETLLGKVFDQFGPLHKPFYTIRFDSNEEIESKHISIDDDVFFLPKLTTTTQELIDSTSDLIIDQNNEKHETCLSSSFGEKEKSVKETVDTAVSKTEQANSDVMVQEASKYQNKDGVPAVPMQEESKSQVESNCLQYMFKNSQSNPLYNSGSTSKVQPTVYQQPSQKVNPQHWVIGHPVYAHQTMPPFQQVNPHMNNPNFRQSLLGPCPYPGPLPGYCPPNMHGVQPHYAMPPFSHGGQYSAPQLYQPMVNPQHNNGLLNNNRFQNLPNQYYAYPVIMNQRSPLYPANHQAAFLHHQTAMQNPQYRQRFPSTYQTPYAEGFPPGYIPPPKSANSDQN